MRALKNVRQHLRSYHLKSGVFHFYRAEHGPAADHLTRALSEEEDKLSSADRRSALYYLVQTRIGAATDFEARSEIDRAIEQYHKALEVMPRYPDVHLRLGEVLLKDGRTTEAITHFGKALEINPLYVQARVRLGFSYLALGEHKQASASFREAQRAREEVACRRIEEAEAAMARGAIGVASDIYKDAFHEDLSFFQQLFDKGMVHLRSEAWEDAAETLREAAELCPRFADVHNYLGVALAEQGRYEPAIRAFERSVAINPEYLVAWLNLAYCGWEAGEIDLTERALLEVLAREPDNAPAQHLQQQRDEAKRAGHGRRQRSRSSATQGSS